MTALNPAVIRHGGKKHGQGVLNENNHNCNKQSVPDGKKEHFILKKTKIIFQPYEIIGNPHSTPVDQGKGKNLKQ